MHRRARSAPRLAACLGHHPPCIIGRVDVRRSRRAATWDRLVGLGPPFWVGLTGVFLLSRLLWLDADVPRWELAWYSPVDEFAYALPAFNLVQYGTWVHQAAPWAPVEGSPTNPVQNLVAAATLWLGGDSYWGLRASSVVFGLIAFLALVAIVRRQADEAVAGDGVSRRLAALVVVAAAALLLVDFSSLVSGRIVEPTVTRLAAAAVLVLLVSRGVFFGTGHGPRRTAAFGAAATAAVLPVYIYNAFLIPAAFLLTAWWAARAGGRSAVVRHLVALTIGGSAVAAAFFAAYFLVYHQSPVDWLNEWILTFATSSRGNGIAWTKVASIAQANIFRLDPAFLGLVLAGLPVFVWVTARRPAPWTVLVLSGLLAFLTQSAFVADYPERKFLMAMLFALPVAAGAVLGWREFRAWAVADRRRLAAVIVWLGGALGVAAFATPLGTLPNAGLLASIVLGAGAIGLVALLGLVLLERRPTGRWLALALGLAIAAPLAYADYAYVYRHPAFTYRDAQAAAASDVNGAVTAGSLSMAMQLYNTSRPVLNGYYSGITAAEYEADVVRMFREGGAQALFTYVDDATRSHYEALGFRLEETYDARLPLGQRMGRYVYAPAGALASPPRG